MTEPAEALLVGLNDHGQGKPDGTPPAGKADGNEAHDYNGSRPPETEQRTRRISEAPVIFQVPHG